ncbi:hypothetical protein CSV79_06315 [Sporosarcina sp. P13]|uniref:Yip1 family protein n=1 Tax=Sporosarcina sp. P13 TaxID=2048263 RepID=UPI000C168D0C|nr:Yip1 family protein [Sporosarcina sp. P13]PIC64566.1 hypothetical protein CSV79_06315 [Sporosarcina sp. P13]
MNPLVSIWTQPKETIRYVLEYKTWTYSFLILFLSAISLGLTSFADTDILPDFSLVATVILAIISTFIGSIISLFIAAGLYTWVGKWLRGKGNFKDMFQMIPISSIPLIWMLPINLLLVVVFGKSLFMDTNEPTVWMSLPTTLLLLTNLLTFGLGIFSLVILSKGIGIVHQFSSWRGFGVIVIIFGIALVLFIPIIVISLFFLIGGIM